jgi:aromatic-L-amino-acid decarboxylase
VPCDVAYRLDVDRLDLDGACAAVATLGTTSSTSVDPVRAIGERCRAAGVWLHVDAAYGGSALVCPEHRDHADGIELADSLVVNPHKWLVTPMDCSIFFTQRPRDVVNAFSLVPEYLRTSDDGVVNLMDYGPALGRRFRALKLWAVLRCYGAEGLRAVIRDHVRMASAFAAWVDAEPGFSVVAPHPFSVVCFRMDGDDAANEALMARVNERGETYISHTKLDGRVVLRLAIGNAATTDDDVRGAWDAIRSAARAGVS